MNEPATYHSIHLDTLLHGNLGCPHFYSGTAGMKVIAVTVATTRTDPLEPLVKFGLDGSI